MDTSQRLGLPFLLPNQAQKHVTVNESLQRLDALVQLSAISTSLTAPPATINDGDIYILPSGTLSGAWTNGASAQVATYQDGTWNFISPGEGWSCYDQQDAQLLRFVGGVWTVQSSSSDPTQLGVNTTADSLNRLSVKSDSELLNHDDITPGTGNARKVINKIDATATASTLFQSGAVGHAEIGLLGNNDLTLQVSADGTTQTTCAQFDRVTGAARFPGGQIHSPSNSIMRQTLPTPGGDGTVSIYRINAVRSANPRTYSVSAIANDTITLTTASAREIIEPTYMQGVSMVRIWNLSKSPIAPAWVIGSSSTATLKVRDATKISNWQNGDTIHFGDPTTETPGRVVAIDISPMMIALFGTPFFQAGIIVKARAHAGTAVESGIDMSSDGSPGSFLGTQGFASQSSVSSQFLIPSTVPSPVSSSNLVFVREKDLGGGVGISSISVNALLV